MGLWESLRRIAAGLGRSGHADAESRRRTAPPDPDALVAARRCLGCGLCDLAFEDWQNTATGEFRGPMTFVLGISAGRPEWAVRQTGDMRRTDLHALELACPVRVPFERLVSELERRAPRRGAVMPRTRHDPG